MKRKRVLTMSGSPPRARGKGGSLRHGDWPAGITPACAGKSFQNRAQTLKFVDHPRVRGEKTQNRLTRCFARGSPPRARGKDHFKCPLVYLFRITPACAGKSSFWLVAFVRLKDHPRVRGEKPHLIDKIAPYVGSPPRARGKEVEKHNGIIERGITPACAGKRAITRKKKPTAQDHPRVRGEKTAKARCNPSDKGSPPRARGKELDVTDQLVDIGITPACAGKSICL